MSMQGEAFTEGDPSADEWRRLLSSDYKTRLDAGIKARLDAEPTHRVVPDPISMPSHYTQLPVECIDVTEHFSFTLGNAIKYIWRADHKGKPLEDLRKAVFYLEREISNRESGKYDPR